MHLRFSCYGNRNAKSYATPSHFVCHSISINYRTLLLSMCIQDQHNLSKPMFIAFILVLISSLNSRYRHALVSQISRSYTTRRTIIIVLRRNLLFLFIPCIVGTTFWDLTFPTLASFSGSNSNKICIFIVN